MSPVPPLNWRELARDLRSIAAIGVIAVATASCDPCFNTIGCSTAPLMSVNGQIVRGDDGRGVPDVRIDVIRSGGVPLALDSTSTVTDRDGHWRVAIPASESGEVTVAVVVSSPLARYRVLNVALRTNTVAGESNVLDRWVVHPTFPISAALVWRGPDPIPVANATAEFRRTSGAELFGDDVDDGIVRGVSDASGRIALFGLTSNVFASSLDVLIGDLTLAGVDGGPVVVHDVRLPANYRYHPPLDVQVIGVGPSLSWVLVALNRATHRPQPGVQVRVTRTGGIATTPSSFTAVSDGAGALTVALRALEAGTLVADLEFTPPAPGEPITMRGVRFETFDSDVARLFGVVDLMPYMPYFGIVKIAGQGASDVTVEFRRTGGIRLQDDLVIARSSLGAVGIHPVPLEKGEVVGDLTIRAPAPYPSFVVHGVRMSTADGEGLVPDRLIHVWDLDSAPTGPPGTTVELLGGPITAGTSVQRSAPR